MLKVWFTNCCYSFDKLKVYYHYLCQSKVPAVGKHKKELVSVMNGGLFQDKHGRNIKCKKKKKKTRNGYRSESDGNRWNHCHQLDESIDFDPGFVTGFQRLLLQLFEMGPQVFGRVQRGLDLLRFGDHERLLVELLLLVRAELPMFEFVAKVLPLRPISRLHNNTQKKPHYSWLFGSS